jgi:IS1 family transposase
MNKLSTAERVSVVAALVEGNSINSTVRMTGISKPTILKLLGELGAACRKYHDAHVRNVAAKRVQCDEVWSFCYAKAKNVPADKRGQFGFGDIWTWTALDADSKLMITWNIGLRDAGYAHEFMQDVSERLANRVQLTTDGHKAYLDAVEDAFLGDVDYAQLVKLYGNERPGEARYSPAICTGCNPTTINGEPERQHVSTSYVERSNLTVRMGMRRFTRLTNGFSKKIDNHVAMINVFFMYYNFCRIHTTLRVTPAMEAKLTTKLWEIEDIVALIEN